MTYFLRKLRWLFQRPNKEAELREELQFHLDEEEAKRLENGVPHDQTRDEARRDFGSVALTQENTRAAWGWMRLEQLARDAAYGLRQLRRAPSFSTIAIATLALGIGGVTAIFSAFDTILIRPLPYTDADSLVMIWDDFQQIRDQSKLDPAPPEMFEWRRLNTVFTDVAATQSGDATLSGDTQPEQVPARKATANFWTLLGVKPILGRVFTQEEDDNGAQVVLLSHGLWQRRYGGSPSVVGRKITMNDKPYEVIGVLPSGFYFLPMPDIDIWMPTSFPPSMRSNFTWHDLHVVAHLKPGVTVERARESMVALSLQVSAKDFRGPHRVVVTTLREELAGKTRSALVLLLCASVALLLIACVNLANLLMSRGTARGREVAVRAALGAGRGRLVVQFLTESLVLAGLGAITALLVALPAMRFLETLVPEKMGAVSLTLDWRVLAFSALSAVAATLIFGLAPALRASQLAPRQGLTEGSRGSTGARSHWFQHSLIVVETALAVALLICGGLLLQTFQNLRNVDIGLKSNKLLTFETPLFRYRDFDRRVAFVNAELERVRAIPGVVNAGAISKVPLTVRGGARFYWLEGQSRDRMPGQVALTRVVTRELFPTIGARLREGRFFEISDRRSESPSAIVNETFANLHFAGQSPLGKRLKFERTSSKGYWYTIVGVVKEVRDQGVLEELKPTIYRLHEQADQTNDEPSGIVVRTAVDPASIVSAVRQAIRSVDSNQPVWRIRTLDDIVDSQLSTPKQSTTLLATFALLALLLASIGLYGVLSYAVAQRTNEIGVRMALGATSRQILLAFGQRGLALTLTGLVVGLVLAAAASRLMTALLYGFQPGYLSAAILVSVILLAVAALACLVPARRASRVDPVVALRS